MGSTGSGRFTDYCGVKTTVTTSGSGGGVGSSGNDRCLQAFSCTLEEVAQCDYFMQTGSVPPVGSPLTLVLQRRLFAKAANGHKVGALPTSFNYLAACMASGVNYAGVVRASSNAPVPSVTVDFAPV